MDRRTAKKTFTARFAPLPLAVSLAAAGMVSGLFSSEVLAACSGIPNVTCNGGTIVGYVSSVNNLTLNVQADAQIIPGISDIFNSVYLSGTGTTVNNSGKIDPSILGVLSAVASGLQISNAAGSTVTVNNNAGGQILGTSQLTAVSLPALTGIGLIVQNGAGGTTTVNNSGIIGGTALLGVSILAEDIPVIALRGGAQNRLTNNTSGVITGRVAFAPSTGGTPSPTSAP